MESKRAIAKRTAQQNKALHAYFRMLANALNDAGFSVQLVLQKDVELTWTTDMVKELLWRPTQKALTQAKSTKQLRKQEDIDLVYEHLNRHISEHFGIHIPFPSMGPGFYDTAPEKDDTVSE